MSLDPDKPKGNPAFKLQHINGPLNPKGAATGPKPLNVKKRVLGKWKTHPVDKLVKIANFAEALNPELSAKIWLRLLDSCEGEEKKKKGYMPPTSTTDTKATEIDADTLLKDLEQDEQSTTEGDSEGLGNGTPVLQTETRPTEDLPEHPR
jgi:hypothetical protein